MIRAMYLVFGGLLGASIDELLRSVWLHEATLVMPPLAIALMLAGLFLLNTEAIETKRIFREKRDALFEESSLGAAVRRAREKLP